MMQTLNNKGVVPDEARMIMARIGDLGLSGDFVNVYSAFNSQKDNPRFKEWVKAVINISKN